MTRAGSRTTRRELTLEQYMRTPVPTRSQEVVDGVIVASPAPTVLHLILRNHLDLELLLHVR
jgi:hypothetical protein